MHVGLSQKKWHPIIGLYTTNLTIFIWDNLDAYIEASILRQAHTIYTMYTLSPRRRFFIRIIHQALIIH